MYEVGLFNSNCYEVTPILTTANIFNFFNLLINNANIIDSLGGKKLF